MHTSAPDFFNFARYSLLVKANLATPPELIWMSASPGSKAQDAFNYVKQRPAVPDL